MSSDKDKELVALCPNLYRDRYGDTRQTCMCWGFEFGDGWYGLVRDLSVKLEALIATAEDISFQTCETCGEPGRRRGGGWIRTLCDVCHAAPRS